MIFPNFFCHFSIERDKKWMKFEWNFELRTQTGGLYSVLKNELSLRKWNQSFRRIFCQISDSNLYVSQRCLFLSKKNVHLIQYGCKSRVRLSENLKILRKVGEISSKIHKKRALTLKWFERPINKNNDERNFNEFSVNFPHFFKLYRYTRDDRPRLCFETKLYKRFPVINRW